MTEHINSQPDNPQYRKVPTGMSLEQFLALPVNRERVERAAQARAEQAANYQQPPQYNGQYTQQPQYFPPQFIPERTTGPGFAEPLKPRRSMSRRARKVAGTTIVIAVSAGLASGAYMTNTGGIQDKIASALGSEPAQAAGLEITPLEEMSTKSLAETRCKDPDAVLLVATVSGEFPLVPLLPSVDGKTLVPSPPYLTQSNINKLPSEKQAKIENFITSDGYPHATLNEMPLALKICDVTDGKGITQKEGEFLTIDRSAFEITFEDPNQLFKMAINAEWQVNGATDVDTDPAQGEYVTIPNPANDMFLAPREGDDAYNKLIDELINNMNSQDQQKIILSMMEIDVVKQLDDEVDYPGSTMTLQKSIDTALLQRILGDTDIVPTITGTYNVQMIVPKNPTTKKPITDVDPATNTSPLKGLDPNQSFQITSIDIQFGTLTPPDVTTNQTTEPDANNLP